MTHLGQKITPMAILHNKALWNLAFLYSSKFDCKEKMFNSNRCDDAKIKVSRASHVLLDSQGQLKPTSSSRKLRGICSHGNAIWEEEKKLSHSAVSATSSRQSLWFVEQLPPSRRRGCTSAGRAGVLREARHPRRLCRLERDWGVEIKGWVSPRRRGAGEVWEFTLGSGEDSLHESYEDKLAVCWFTQWDVKIAPGVRCTLGCDCDLIRERRTVEKSSLRPFIYLFFLMMTVKYSQCHCDVHYLYRDISI